MPPRREPLTVVCVFNDPAVLEECLRRSFDAATERLPDTELIAVDNVGHTYSTAGAALTHGADQARNAVLAFAHQDVVLHSLLALEEAAAVLTDSPEIGVLGPCGIDSTGGIRGRIRDRIVLIGTSAPSPVDVDSLDEVLFLVRADHLRDEPLASDPELAWHAYAVEYGLRARSLGRRVCALDAPITHNSLTVNLARLDEAHVSVGRRYPELLPLRTTCGVVSQSARSTNLPGPVWDALAPHRWRYRWLRESARAMAGRRQRRASHVLSDIRLDIDEILDVVHDLAVVNVDDGSFGTPESLRLRRREHSVSIRAAGQDEALATLRLREPSESVLVTNLDGPTITRWGQTLDHPDVVLGFATDLGHWVLAGPAASVTPRAWRQPRARPLALRTPA